MPAALSHRTEAHRGEAFFNFVMNERLHQLVRCILGLAAAAEASAPRLRLYPVYMLRGKVPDYLNKGFVPVLDWHQDAAYTYYWYSQLNTTRQQVGQDVKDFTRETAQDIRSMLA